MAGHGVKRNSESPLFVAQENSNDGSGGSSPKRARNGSRTDSSRPSIATSTPATSYSHTASEVVNGRVSPYNLRVMEQRPRLAVYCASFARAEQCISEVVNKFTASHNRINAGGRHNAAVARVCDGLRKLQDPAGHYKRVGPVACLGAAGVGKSSTINSILSQKMAAPEHNGDERGTYVVFEYIGPAATQFMPYHVEVPFRLERAIALLVIRHHGNILKSQLPEDELDENEEEDLKQKCETAFEFFQSLICDHKDFQTLDDVETFFDDHKDDDQQTVVDFLVGNIVGFLQTRSLQNGQEIYECVDERDLNEVFKKVARPLRTRGNADKQPSPWPLVVKVKVRQDLDLLNAGLVLADTPGLNDSNLTVVENTTTYLTDADTILVFAGIKRISKNETLDQQLKDCINLGKERYTVLVVTMIDEKTTYSDYEREGLEQSEVDALLAKEAKIQVVESEMRDAETHKTLETDNDRFRELDERITVLNQRLVEMRTELKQIVVEIHCREVGIKLKEKFRQLTKSKSAPDLPVLFISNTQYQKHLAGYQSSSPPVLDVQATGIPALRSMLYSIVTRGKFDTLKMIAKHRLPHAIKGVEGILTRTNLERKGEVRSDIEQQLHSLDELAIGAVNSILQSFKKHITSVVIKGNEKWSERGAKTAKTWEKTYKSPTYAAFCRKGGYWKLPKTKEIVSWNGVICDIMHAKLEAAFENFIDDLDREIIACEDRLAGMFVSFKSAIETAPAAQGMDLQAFFDIIDHSKQELMVNISDHTESLREIGGNVRRAMTLDGKDNYAAEAMKETYDACVLLSSKTFGREEGHDGKPYQPKNRRLSKKNGPSAKRVEMVSQKLSGNGAESVFLTVGKKAKNDLVDRLTTWKDSVKGAINAFNSDVLRDFDERFHEAGGESEENEQDPCVVEALQDAVRDALDTINGPLAGYLEECEAYGKGA